MTLQNRDILINCESWRNFCNCSICFREIKKNFVYYELNCSYSMAYICCSDNCGREKETGSIRETLLKIASLVSNFQTQIMLTIGSTLQDLPNDHPYRDLAVDNSFLDLHGEEISKFVYVSSHESESFTSFAHLVNVQYLDSWTCLSRDHQRSDIGNLRNAKVISLRAFFIQDLATELVMSILRNCLELDLSDTNIIDVSLLKC
jgi:hypothetical protein